MRSEENDPLPLRLWLTELDRLSVTCLSASGQEEDRAVRRAYYLMKLAPPSLRSILAPFLMESDVEAMLEQGRAEQAAMLIVGERARVSFSQSLVTHGTLASLTYDDSDPVMMEAATPALALIAAWAKLLARGQ